ncbi:OLC1v1002015C1 [Oldenlandia corymbosa var. corymbosa]|uniref:OLC1v1002015C1 n=1 Tax=Oldenlandia corymbosa var. corymbosa TaxID=529605 RepID=A0AAV1D7C0_OLDCO|nr:OLC1v1002015C1 [Oldenlandia corymbosa var. corymbosa]
MNWMQTKLALSTLYTIILLFNYLLKRIPLFMMLIITLTVLKLSVITCCRTSVLEKASKSVWEMMLDNNGLGKEISETVERVFCRLSGKEAPLYSQNNIEALLEKAKEVDAEGSREKELKRNTENSHSSSKKRKPDETSKEDGANGVADGSNATVPGPFDDSSRMPHPNAKT